MVLVGSCFYNKIKTDQVSITFFENIAGADMALVIVKVLPKIIVLISNGWHLGEYLAIIITGEGSM